MPSARQSIRARLSEAGASGDVLAFGPDPHPLIERDGVFAGTWDGAPRDVMPPDCPVTVLGYSGEIVYCIGANGQLYQVEKFDKPMLQKLFAPYPNYMYWAWPSLGKKPPIRDGEEHDDYQRRLLRDWQVRLQADHAAECMLSEAARRGLFDPSNQLRGRGGWADSTGAFIWHSGTTLYRSHVSKRGKRDMKQWGAGLFDDKLYERLPPTFAPWSEPVNETETPADELLRTLATWTWERPQLDPVMMLGWLVSSLMGAALDWRPMLFTTGGAGVGKSSLHGMVQACLGTALHATADTTPAGIYQRVKNDCLPVTVDELEAKANDGRARAVIELARLASSGSRMFRGGSDPSKNTAFELRNTFMFSAINPPPMNDQDKSRMAVLNLGKIDKSRIGTKLPVLSDEVGRMLLRQVIDGWDQFSTKLLPEWKGMLHRKGFDSRAADTYGTLLAAAELVVGADTLMEVGLPIHDDDALGELIAVATYVERAEQLENWHKCILYIMNAQVDEYRGGEKRTVGQVIGDAFEDKGASTSWAKKADDTLKSMQLRFIAPNAELLGGALFVPHGATATGLNRALRETDYFNGVWSTALKQAPDRIVLRGSTKRFQMRVGKIALRGVLIDLDQLERYETALGEDEGEAQ